MFIAINSAFVKSFLTSFGFDLYANYSYLKTTCSGPFWFSYNTYPSYLIIYKKIKGTAKTVPLNILYFVPDKLLFRLFAFAGV